MKMFIKSENLIILVLLSLILTLTCTHDDEVEPILNGGSEVGELYVDTNGPVWRFDKPHSNIEWETAYLGELALLTGRFSNFNIDLVFDEKNIENSSIDAYVVITSNITGEPNRDRLGGCLTNTLGVIHNGDTLEDGSLDPAGIDSLSNVASFSSTNISRIEGNEYLAKGFLNFHGVKSPIDLTFRLVEYYDRSEAKDGTDLRAGFSGEFTMFAKSIFEVESNNIGDEVTIKINCETRLR